MKAQKQHSVSCFSPVAGIQWVETQNDRPSQLNPKQRFSPVAGIQWVETSFSKRFGWGILVSVPLPGFSGLRLPIVPTGGGDRCFSPVAGIQWVETFIMITHQSVKRIMVSVPLPGFSGLRLSGCLP